jgi:hypothetical protein
MINNNKILTVSYGTFSCTLEGFDDSFGTMKAIAEYFRDLSADDRYFGAEPAQPDAQMLARIAQREISRHVEAREDEGHIVLSAQDADHVATPLIKDVADADEAIAVEIPEVEEQAITAPTLEEIVDADETPEPEVVEVQPVAEIEQPAVDIDAIAAAVTVESSAVEPEQDIVPSLPDAEVEAFFADSADSTMDEVEDAFEAEAVDVIPAPERATADSIADKLKRIRAVVSQQSDVAEDPAYSEDQHADAASSKAAAIIAPVADLDEEDVAHTEDSQKDVLASTLRDLEDALDTDDAIQSSAELEDDLDDEEDDITAILNRLEQESDLDTAPEVTAEYEDDDMDDDILAAMDSLVAAPEEDDLDDLDDGTLFDGDEIAEVEIETTPALEAPKAAAPRTRVLKVKRATLEAAIKAGKLEEYDSEDTAQPEVNESSLSDSEEEELARELAELEADMKADAPSESESTLEDIALELITSEVETDEHDEVETSPSVSRSDVHGAAGEDLSRLMAETDNQMGEPESTNRRDAFAHLRAAVAAKKADEAVGGTSDPENTDVAYRDDLASVVRPRRPVSGSSNRTERPAEQRPAPLKLVAEQRIDVSETKNVTPVRPRRVAAVVPAPVQDVASDSGSFADFAADVGAEKLPDILEAAAAYLSFIEGHAQFSRPQLMTKVRQVEKENFTREDSLRSFGKLLREGKIEKLKGGRFQASDQIGYKPDARAAS